MSASRLFLAFVIAVLACVGIGIIFVAFGNSGNGMSCPGSFQVRHIGTNQCFRIGEHGPCSNNLVVTDVGDGLGECSCSTGFNRTFIYSKHLDECHFVFTQGPCKDDEWFTIDTSTYEPICSKAACLAEEVPFKIEENIVTCIKLPMDEETKLQTKCTTTISFDKNFLFPKCRDKYKKPTFSIAAIGPAPIKCPIGSYQSAVGKCQPEFDFDFFK